MWESSFVAATVLSGSSVDDAIALLDARGAARAAAIVARLRDPKRAGRALALAEAAKEIALAIDEVALR